MYIFLGRIVRSSDRQKGVGKANIEKEVQAHRGVSGGWANTRATLLPYPLNFHKQKAFTGVGFPV